MFGRWLTPDEVLLIGWLHNIRVVIHHEVGKDKQGEMHYDKYRYPEDIFQGTVESYIYDCKESILTW